MGNYDFTKQPSLLIQGAMDTETAYFIEHLEEHECVTIGNWKFHTGFLGAKREPVIISKTFQGMVNAAAATSLALAYFKPWAVINQDPHAKKRYSKERQSWAAAADSISSTAV